MILNAAHFFYGWVIVFMGVVGILCSMPGQTAGVSPFTEHFMEVLDLTRVELSTSYLIGTLLAGLLLPRCGHLYDSYGVRPVIVVTFVALGGALVATSYCGEIYRVLDLPEGFGVYWAFFLITVSFFFLRLWGQGVLTMVSRAMVAKWFNYKRGMATAMVGTFSALSFSCAPFCLYVLVDHWGWRETLFILGMIYMFVMSLFSWCFSRDNPESCGLPVDGTEEPLEKTVSKDLRSEFTIHHEFTAGEAVRTLAFWIYSLALGFHGLLGTAIAFHAISFAEEMSIEAGLFYTLWAPSAIFNIGAGFFFGWMNNKTPLKTVLFLYLLLQFGFQFSLIVIPSFGGKLAYVFLSGVVGAGFGNLVNVTWPRYFGRVHLGKISGRAMSILVICSAIGPYVFSLIYRAFGSYIPAICLCSGLTLVLTLIALKVENPQRKFIEEL